MKGRAGVPQLIANKALKLCGTRFRLHGRGENNGLDCIGLAAECLSHAGIKCDVPTGYALRGGNIDRIDAFMCRTGFEQLEKGNPARNGDIILVRPGPLQLHFVIRVNGGFVHAHAGLRKVVFSPGEPDWPIVKRYRFAVT